MNTNIFEKIKHFNSRDQEFWRARELFKILGYAEYSKFLPVIEKAKLACEASKQKVSLHFAHASEMVAIGLGVGREVDDFQLSRYACYLIAQNGDPRKEEIARAQTYFAIQTRRQELGEQLIEDRNRIQLRNDIKENNKKLASAAKAAGVSNYANFQDFGYVGLYGGLRQKDIHKKKNLKPKESILDHMGSEELAANLFRATQAEAKLKRENIFGESEANKTHLDIGKKVRKTIAELGGTMPEKLPTPVDIKEAKKRIRVGGKKVKNLK
jgi:DNA-damage-inducible protein D